MNLLDFELEIEPVIVARGQNYFDSGYILSFVAMGNGEYKAQVEGSEYYSVDVKLDEQGTILQTSCTCPYDFGPCCKHQVAVFLALREQHYGSDTCGTVDLKSAYAQTYDELDFRPVLENRSKDELIDFICYLAASNEEVAQRVDLAFNVKDDQAEVKKARALIRSSIYRASAGGFVHYRDTWQAVSGASDVQEMAKSALDQGLIIQAVRLALCLIGEMTDLLQSSDDSNGIIGDKIAAGLDICCAVASQHSLTAFERDTLLDLIMTEAMHVRYEGWPDQQLDLFDCGLRIVESPEQRQLFLQQLAKLKSRVMQEEGPQNNWSTSYLLERIELFRYRIVQQFEGEQAAFDYLMSQLDKPKFREIAVEMAISRGDDESVIQLATAGIESSKGLPGLIKKWQVYLHDAYQRLGLIPAQREIARLLVLGGDEMYYTRLKQTYDPQEWAMVWPDLLAEIRRNRYLDRIYTAALIQEKAYDQLMDYVRENPSTVLCYYSHLIDLPQYRDEVLQLFERIILEKAAFTGGRGHYQQLRDLIGEFAKTAGAARAQTIRDELLAQYPRRSAMRDELLKL